MYYHNISLKWKMKRLDEGRAGQSHFELLMVWTDLISTGKWFQQWEPQWLKAISPWLDLTTAKSIVVMVLAWGNTEVVGND